ncbi:hypothetical protein ACFZ8E_05820 [Methylobacterium sp. HMF5984]|uniref:hypothetical protein n=1 Tax=Methylobacterium sp. HMF5984 TaxID=3367370 RepID=UPI0038536F35
MSEALRFALPLRIMATAESVQVVDRAGRVIFYVYVCAEPERRMNTKRLSPEEGIAVAQIAARALTDRVERGE